MVFLRSAFRRNPPGPLQAPDGVGDRAPAPEAPISTPIRIVVGLGNPGARYDGTRHNIGFDAVASFLEGRPSRPRHFDGGEMVETEIADRTVVVLRPTTWMNRSGGPVRRCLGVEAAPPAAALIVCDDFALPLGSIRTRRRGSDGGHNGLASILRALGTNEVPRMRLGVGAPPAGEDPADYVLRRFEKAEEAAATDLAARAAEAIGAALSEGVAFAMNRFNRRLA